MLATWTASCNSGCQVSDPSPFAPGTPIVDGQALSGSIAYSNSLPSRTDTFNTSYSLQLVSPGSVIDAPAPWSAPELRCDNRVSASPGCVVPSVAPTFNVDRIEFPLAAAGVEWAQNNLAGAPGKKGVGEPLHRNANFAQQQANRNRVCRTGWTTIPSVPNDSCDEFPFAATKEGGSMSGSDCAEIVPQANGTFIVVRAGGVGITCSRAHVPTEQNSGVGGDLGRFTQEQRVIDGEAYWVSTL